MTAVDKDNLRDYVNWLNYEDFIDNGLSQSSGILPSGDNRPGAARPSGRASGMPEGRSAPTDWQVNYLAGLPAARGVVAPVRSGGIADYEERNPLTRSATTTAERRQAALDATNTGNWDDYSYLHNIQAGLGALGIGSGADFNVPGAPISIAEHYGRSNGQKTWTPQQREDERKLVSPGTPPSIAAVYGGQHWTNGNGISNSGGVATAYRTDRGGDPNLLNLADPRNPDAVLAREAARAPATPDKARERTAIEQMRLLRQLQYMRDVPPNSYYPYPYSAMKQSETPAPADDSIFPAPVTMGDDMSAFPSGDGTLPTSEPVTDNIALGGEFGGDGSKPTKEPTMSDRVIDGAGKILSHTTLGSIVSTLFPDQWNGGGQAIKDWMNTPHSHDTAPDPNINPVTGLPWWMTDIDGDGKQDDTDSGSPGANKGGKDDDGKDDDGKDDDGKDDDGKDDTPTTPTTPGAPVPPKSWFTGAYDPFGDVVFPGAGYRPGIDNEWLYFRKHMAEGGPVIAYADGGEVDMNALLNNQDPRVVVIADAEDAIHNAAIGAPEPDDGEALQRFVDMFGQDALKQLARHAGAGQKLRPAKPRLVKGEGGPKDDAIPARIDDVHEARLSDGEFVFPAEAVMGAGEGDPMAGAQRLQQLADAFSGKKPDDKLNVERVG